MTRWQEEWSSLSKNSRDRLRRYAGHGPSKIKKMRAGMFMPKHPDKKIRFWDRLDMLVFKSALKHHPDIVVGGSRSCPYARKEPRSPGYIGMPKDPVKWAAPVGSWKHRQLSKVAGLFCRNTLEHEYAELRLFRIKSKRNGFGRFMRGFKAIFGKRSHHNGVQPLIAELNASGRCKEGVKMLIKDWSDQPGQNQIFALLKQFGWTPSYGIPVFGRVANRVQRRVERIFAPHFRELIGTQIKRVERKYRGRALKRKKEEILDGAACYAGGSGLRKKYLK